jgi:protein-tyrosine phosphatase
MIDHPERNRDIVNDYVKLRPFLEQGCLTQITASALTGQFGSASQYRAEQLVGDGMATCLASDAHNTGNRPPCLSRGMAAAAALIGRDAAEVLGRDNPWRIVADRFTAAVAS